MLPAQQIIGKIETSQHIKTGANDTDRRDGVVIHQVIIDFLAWLPYSIGYVGTGEGLLRSTFPRSP